MSEDLYRLIIEIVVYHEYALNQIYIEFRKPEYRFTE